MKSPNYACPKPILLLTITLLSLGLVANAGPSPAQKVYIGAADNWKNFIKQPNDWSYVREHADGFYVNFIMLNQIIRHARGLTEEDLKSLGSLFSTRHAYLESDIRSPVEGGQGGGGGGKNDGASAQQERAYIKMLHAAGFLVEFTSLNYGWSPERSANLTRFDLMPGEHRLNFVQTAPWAMNGNISGPSMANRPGYNEKTRDEILAADGVSTDEPLGFWRSDRDHIHSATVSLIRFAHKHHKSVMIMLAPYGARQPGYIAKTDSLAVAQGMVRYLESQHASPDVWSVFEYATDIPAVPEQVDGQPANTTSGIAYWLIQHIHNPRQFP